MGRYLILSMNIRLIKRYIYVYMKEKRGKKKKETSTNPIGPGLGHWPKCSTLSVYVYWFAMQSNVVNHGAHGEGCFL